MTSAAITWVVFGIGYVLQEITDAYITYALFYMAPYSVGSADSYLYFGIAVGCLLWSLTVMSSIIASSWSYSAQYWLTAGRADEGTIQGWLVTLS